MTSLGLGVRSLGERKSGKNTESYVKGGERERECDLIEPVYLRLLLARIRCFAKYSVRNNFSFSPHLNIEAGLLGPLHRVNLVLFGIKSCLKMKL